MDKSTELVQWAFESRSWPKVMSTALLTRVFLQSDAEFVEVLVPGEVRCCCVRVVCACVVSECVHVLCVCSCHVCFVCGVRGCVYVCLRVCTCDACACRVQVRVDSNGLPHAAGGLVTSARSRSLFAR